MPLSLSLAMTRVSYKVVPTFGTDLCTMKLCRCLRPPAKSTALMTAPALRFVIFPVVEIISNFNSLGLSRHGRIQRPCSQCRQLSGDSIWLFPFIFPPFDFRFEGFSEGF